MKHSSLPHSGKFKLCVLTLALVAGVNAHAATTTAGVINPGKATATAIGTASGSKSTSAFTIDQYNGGGVLTGASISAGFVTEGITFSSTSPNSAEGSANAVGGFAVGGVTGSATSASTTKVTGVHSGTSKTGTIAAYTVTGSATSQAQLDALAGTGTVKGSAYETLSVNLTKQSNAGDHRRNFSADNSTTPPVTITYDYTSLNHADGALGINAVGNNSLTLDFTAIANGTAPTALGFNLYNLMGSYGLQVVSVTPAVSGLFTLNGITSGLTYIGGGSSSPGTVSMSGQTAPGTTYTGEWSIVVADSAAAAAGIGGGRNLTGLETLTLYATATVAAVPEPESYAMLLAGLGLIGTIAVRRRNQNNG